METLPTFKEDGEYEVVFMYSDKEKNFKRIADCTPEIQKFSMEFEAVDEILDEYFGY